MNIRNTCFVAASIALSGCSHYESDAKQAVLEKTRDPSSVQFKGIVSSANNDSYGQPHPVVCGYYNAKNAYGGYIGFEPFIFDDGRLFVGEDGYSLYSKCPV